MDFGYLEQSQLENLSFGFQETSWVGGSQNELKMTDQKKKKIYVGSSKWGNKSWVGKTFPKGTEESEYLHMYARNFNSIELNNTFYKEYSSRSISHWAAKTQSKHFLYCPKMYKGVTHQGSLLDIEQNNKILDFLQSIKMFGFQLGPIFLELPETFSTERTNELLEFIDRLPAKYESRYYFEVRHQSWFEQKGKMQPLSTKLSEKNHGLIITDTVGRRDAVHMTVINKSAFVRFSGYGNHPSDIQRLETWRKKIKEWLEEGLEELFFFIHLKDEALFPELSTRLIKGINEDNGLELKLPRLDTSYRQTFADHLMGTLSLIFSPKKKKRRL